MSSLTWRTDMAATFAPEWTAETETVLFVDELDDAVAEWTLDELDRSADLGSMRSAWGGADDLNE
jgi:hypothetical protein